MEGGREGGRDGWMDGWMYGMGLKKSGRSLLEFFLLNN